MDVDTSWRRKRPIEDEEEYLASKRYISEKFFNMRISHPDMPGLHGAGSVWQGAAGKAAGEIEGNAMSDEESPPAGAPLKPAAAARIDNNGGFTNPNALDEGDADAIEASAVSGATAAAGGLPTPHPLVRSASSTVDEKVDDWVRSSRHRMLADASVNSAPDLCRALILYKPVAAVAPSGSGGAAPAEGGGGPAFADGEDDGGEGGGDPTPSPQSGGDGGGETAPPSAAAAAGLGAMARGGGRSSAQSAGSSTAEAAGFTGGGERTTGQSHSYTNGIANDHANGRHHHHHVAGSLFGVLPRGLCTAQAGGDDAGGAMLMRDDSSAAMLMMGEDSGAMMATRDDGDVGRGMLMRDDSSAAMFIMGEDRGAMMATRDDGDVGRGRLPVSTSVDAMDMDAAGDEAGSGSGGAGGLASLDSPPPEPPALTRVGTSRGAPTPGLTAERASWARTANQRAGQGHGGDPDEMAGGSNARPPLTAQAWARW